MVTVRCVIVSNDLTFGYRGIITQTQNGIIPINILGGRPLTAFVAALCQKQGLSDIEALTIGCGICAWRGL